MLRRLSFLLLIGFAVLGLTRLATARGEAINAVWLLTTALAVYVIAYRYYGRWIAQRVLACDDQRRTPAYRHEDGLDYVPTSPGVLFGHHFAAIAGAGPLIGPVLAAQLGYLPGTLWILAGVVLGGAVQDMLILFFSVRRNGRSLGEIIHSEIGRGAGLIASVGILAISVILLAVLALVVVQAVAASPWSAFTLAATVPIALFMGIYLRWLRPGRVIEASLLGLVLLFLAIVGGAQVAASPSLAALFTLSAGHLAWLLMTYAAIASILPVWLLLAPRDYLSTFLKLGTLLALAIGIVFTHPLLRMPALTRFIDGHGPVFAGSVFPFLFITIACGAISGFHALVASGTTPKMLQKESQILPIGYGAMLCESAVAIMAMIATSIIDPGVYFAMNAPTALLGHDVQHATSVINHWGFALAPGQLSALAAQMGEHSLLARVGGAPTLAVGLASLLSGVTGPAFSAFWYHFAILFEALFILTTVDAGTRVGRFLLQDLLGHLHPALAQTRSWPSNIFASLLFVAAWGYFLLVGVHDPLGGIHTLWPLFGIANQMLAGMALLLACVILVRMRAQAYLWVSALPAVWILLSTLTAAYDKLASRDPGIGFMAHAQRLQIALAQGQLLAPATSLAQMRQMLFNDRLDSLLCLALALLLLSMGLFALAVMRRTWRLSQVSTVENDDVSVAILD